MDAAATPISMLAGACVSLSGVIVVLFLRLEAAHKRIQDLQTAHKDELKTETKETTRVLLEQTEKHFEAQKPVVDLLRSLIGTKPQA